ncbi:MAG TPA: zf-HC2 domain-containing protein [Gemmatimonadaceae bacterium]
MTLTCEQVDERMAAWIEGDLDQPARDEIGAHLRECLRCAAVVRDISAIRREATRLPELEPSRDLWEGIAARIQAPVIELGARRAPAPSRRIWSLTAAAVLLVTVTSGITYSIAMRRGAGAAVATGSGDPVTSDPGPLTSVVRSEPLAPELVYDREIEQLRLVLNERRADLDSATVTVVEQSLRTIDVAIAEARAALTGDSSSPFLHDRLNRALQKKLGVLRMVALLPAGAS